MRKLFFVGILLVGLFCGTLAVLAKEDGTEDCDAVALERVLAQAEEIVDLGSFLPEVVLALEEVKMVIGGLITENFSKYPILAGSKEEYVEAIRHFFGQSSQPRPK